MAGTRPQVVTMSLNTVPPVVCGLQAHGGGGRPQLALAQSERFVAVLIALVVELPSIVSSDTEHITLSM